MRRRKTRRRFKSRSIIYISAIVALNFMGLGYAMWEEAHNINLSITTGNIDSQITNVSTVSGDGEIELYLSEDNKKLSIEGVYYPSSIIDISIGVENKGSIPVVLNDKSVRSMSFNNGISNLQELSDEDFVICIQSDRESTPLYTYEFEEYDDCEEYEDYEGDIQDYQDSSYQTDILSCQAEIQRLESSINKHLHIISKIEGLIDEAKKLEEQHSFSYSLQYVQGQ